MSDLTDRLRALSIGADCTFTAHVAFREAADEIDRLTAELAQVKADAIDPAEVMRVMAERDKLRKALHNIVAFFEPCAWGSETNRVDALNAARAALKGKG